MLSIIASVSAPQTRLRRLCWALATRGPACDLIVLDWVGDDGLPAQLRDFVTTFRFWVVRPGSGTALGELARGDVIANVPAGSVPLANALGELTGIGTAYAPLLEAGPWCLYGCDNLASNITPDMVAGAERVPDGGVWSYRRRDWFRPADHALTVSLSETPFVLFPPAADIRHGRPELAVQVVETNSQCG